jgi:sulfate transport system substrate-binding protein
MATATVALVAAAMALVAAACGSRAGDGGDGTSPHLTLAAYTTPREAYGEILPLFSQAWRDRTGTDVAFEASYLGSGAQSRAVVGGFEADVVALSLEADVDRIADAGLISEDWREAGPAKGMVSRSVVVIAVREGNPEGIRDWVDLVRPGLEILTPDPKTSGGAQWNVLAMAGAVERGHVPGYEASAAGSERFLADVFANVTVLDKAARESITNFEKGVGDVAITYENEVLVGRAAGQTYESVMPGSTILIENPAAVVDSYVDRHQNRELAEAFRDFLWTPEAQRVYVDHGLRPVDESVAVEVADRFVTPADLFTIEHFGGWSQVTEPWFGSGGVYDRVMEAVRREG